MLQNKDRVALSPQPGRATSGSQKCGLTTQGHRLKNPRIQLVQRLAQIPAAVRVIITGTPVQNNLMEMHSLFDFVCEVNQFHSATIARQ
jgi:hypothetical protein